MRRKILLQLVVPLLSLCVLFLLLATDPAAPRQETVLVELSVLFRESDSAVWTTARQGMEQAAADLGAELRFLTLSAANDAQEQAQTLAREVSGGAQGVLLVPADRGTLAAELGSITVPVVTLETNLAGRTTYVGVDNALVGRTLGEAALNGAAEGDVVVLLDSVPGETGVQERMQAAGELLEAEGRTVRICAPGSGQTLEEALERSLALVRPKLVLAFEPAALETAARVFQTWEDPPLLYGMGTTNATAAYLEQGIIVAMAAQNEYSTGYLAVEALIQAVRNMPIDTRPQEFSLIRKETMYQPENQKLLFPVTG